jgi:hypothetical protein
VVDGQAAQVVLDSLPERLAGRIAAHRPMHPGARRPC